MTDDDERLFALLTSARPEPPRSIDVDQVWRRARRQRLRNASLPAGFLLLVAVVLVPTIALTRGSGTREEVVSPGPSPTSTVTPAGKATVSVRPSTGLANGQKVTIVFTGFQPGEKVYFSECATLATITAQGCGGQLAGQVFMVADAGGGGVVLAPVHAGSVDGPPGEIDGAACTPDCLLVATDTRTTTYSPISFGPQPPTPSTEVPVPADAPFTVIRRVPLQQRPIQTFAAAGNLYTIGCRDCRIETGQTLTRIDPATGAVGPTIDLPGASELAYAGQRLWVARGGLDDAGEPMAPPSLVALDPTTLSVRRTVALPERPGGLATAGGLVWVAGINAIRAIDPSTAAVVRTVTVDNKGAPGGYYVSLAASPDGRTLWTGTGTYGGGPATLAVRDPVTGVVRASSIQNLGLSLSIAAADDHAWLAFSTGMLGAFVREDVRNGHIVQTVVGPFNRFANGINVHLLNGQLWILDGMTGTVACDQDSNGDALTAAQLELPDDSLSAVSPDRLAIIVNGQLLIVKPKSACQR